MSTGPSTRRRTKAEIQQVDAKIRPLYAQGQGCRRVAAEIGESPALVYKRVRAMGIARAHVDTRQKAPTQELPFSSDRSGDLLRFAALGEAASWFLRRGYTASVPLTPAQYDLVVESDDGFQRVQIKTTTHKDRYGRWSVRVSRMEYVASADRRRRAYRPDEVDLFFIVAGDDSVYLIPIAVTGGATSLTLDEKYFAYRIER
jgi:PD-(D/E)XK endonuclease